MEAINDIRWVQRFGNFRKALVKLNKAIMYLNLNFLDEGNPEENKNLDHILKQGLIQIFEYTHQLSLKVIKDYAFYQGNSAVGGTRDATREALQLQIISEGKVWMEMIASRNRTSYTYNDETADEIFFKIREEYQPAFSAFQKVMEEKIIEMEQNLLNEE